MPRKALLRCLKWYHCYARGIEGYNESLFGVLVCCDPVWMNFLFNGSDRVAETFFFCEFFQFNMQVISWALPWIVDKRCMYKTK